MSRTARTGAALTGGTSHRFGRERRLLRKKDFTQVFRAPLRLSDSCFTILATPNAGGKARLGLGISRRAAPRAVDRNRLKRLVRESFRRQTDLPAVDVVVLARSAALHESNTGLYGSLDQLWRRLRRGRRARQDRQHGNG